jgi:hypothetical protein
LEFVPKNTIVGSKDIGGRNGLPPIPNDFKNLKGVPCLLEVPKRTSGAPFFT